MEPFCIEIKKMETPEEFSGKAFVHWKTWHEAYPGLVSAEYLEKLTLEKCEEIAHRWSENILVAKDKERVVGFVGFGDRGEEAPGFGEIFAMYVLPEYHGTGVAQKLMEAGLAQLKDYPEICLWVLRENRRAIRFYEKCGFLPNGDESYSPNCQAEEIRMVLHRDHPSDSQRENAPLQPLKDFQAVIFDMDGVLFDSERTMLECWDEAARAHGFEGIERYYPDTIGVNAERTREIIMEAYGETFPYETIDRERMELYRARYGGGKLPVKEGAARILSFLKQKGVKLALASSSGRKKAAMQLQSSGFQDYFDAVITGDMVQKSKPDPQIFLTACEKIGADPARTYVIEDSYEGIRAAHRGGFHPIMIPDMLPANEEMKLLSETILSSLDEAVQYLSVISAQKEHISEVI